MSRKTLPHPVSPPIHVSKAPIQRQPPIVKSASLHGQSPLRSPAEVLQWQQIAGNRATLQRLGLVPRPPNLSVARMPVIQRIKFRLKADNDDQRGQRETPGQIMEILQDKHPLFAELWHAKDAALMLTVNYAGGADHGDTVTLRDDERGVTFFRVTLYWKPTESLQEALTTFIHEFALHVLPKWELHKSAKQAGQLSEKTFPDLGEAEHKEAERQEHTNLDSWVEAVKIAKQIDKGVVQGVIQDAFYYLKAKGIVALAVKIGMPEHVVQACIDGSFATPKMAVEVPTTPPATNTMVVVNSLAEAIQMDWDTGATFSIKGITAYHCRITAPHKAGDSIFGHLQYVLHL